MSKPLDVFVRVRPLTSNEKGSKTAVECLNEHEVQCGDKKFVFDRVFDELCSQEVLFYSGINILVDRCLNSGKSTTIMAYGQTSSGKSFTMHGSKSDSMPGLVPRAVARVCACYKGTLTVSCFEVYSDKARDLLNHKTELQVLGNGTLANVTTKRFRNGGSSGKRGINSGVIANACLERLEACLDGANAQRSTSATKMNSESSRSHSVVCIQFEDVVNKPTLSLIDLAGSETVRKSGASGDQLKEAAGINQSLTSLAKVLNSLCTPLQNRYIPFRESKLTQILQQSFQQSCKVCLIVNCSPAEEHLRETINSLRFGARAKAVTYEPSAGNKKQLVRQYIQKLETEMRRWELHGPPDMSEWMDLAVPESITETLAVLGESITPAEEHTKRSLNPVNAQTSIGSECPEIAAVIADMARIETAIANEKERQKKAVKIREESDELVLKKIEANKKRSRAVLEETLTAYRALNELYDIKLERFKHAIKLAGTDKYLK